MQTWVHVYRSPRPSSVNVHAVPDVKPRARKGDGRYMKTSACWVRYTPANCRCGQPACQINIHSFIQDPLGRERQVGPDQNVPSGIVSEIIVPRPPKSLREMVPSKCIAGARKHDEPNWFINAGTRRESLKTIHNPSPMCATFLG